MTTDRARRLLILFSLIVTGSQIIFLLIAPVVGYPLSQPKNLELLQIISPVFLGYLGAASHFIFKHPQTTLTVRNEYLGLLLIGPMIIYILVTIAAFSAFGYSNRSAAEIGTGMSVENLATALSLSLGVLAVTTGVLTSYLFVPETPTSI